MIRLDSLSLELRRERQGQGGSEVEGEELGTMGRRGRVRELGLLPGAAARSHCQGWGPRKSGHALPQIWPPGSWKGDTKDKVHTTLFAIWGVCSLFCFNDNDQGCLQCKFWGTRFIPRRDWNSETACHSLSGSYPTCTQFLMEYRYSRKKYLTPNI